MKTKKKIGQQEHTTMNLPKVLVRDAYKIGHKEEYWETMTEMVKDLLVRYIENKNKEGEEK